MTTGVWRVRYTREELPEPRTDLPFEVDVAGWPQWLGSAGLEVGTPFLVSPVFEYDIALNGFFGSPGMRSDAVATQQGYARDLAAFFTFLWQARDRRSWRDADVADHLAYLTWRRRDGSGPKVAGRTWDREVAAVDRFYRWAVGKGHVGSSPIPQTSRRHGVGGQLRRQTMDEQRPATYAHDSAHERIEWLPPAAYRRWRDIGVRGFSAEGLPRSGFRGRWAARNAVFCDLMVRTGLRLSEQGALTVFDVPQGSEPGGGYRKFWLPKAIAKGSSARWIYVAGSVQADLEAVQRWDRAEVIAVAAEEGRYRRWRRPWVVEDPGRALARRVGTGDLVKVSHLRLAERRKLLMDGPEGLVPAMFWLGERGEPLSVSSWKEMFGEANRRCAAAGVGLHAHAHLLRHTFAVVTLEQLQRGHLVQLAELSSAQREHYTRIFGDPLDWVRRRLGHRSVVTTQIYLHALAELEMETRMALVPSDWDLPVEPDDAALEESGSAR
ncbi:site-specific integrase [Nocardia puris]|uniref:tyrosine-type recombinase/integrase n=1 Tax=Nocardia puris TaxID=208602 RepID=UPI001895F83F|nr:site-specific integrase [Nocardia puris]MBF6215977.1 site-specific integrase [Nocardia puris]